MREELDIHFVVIYLSGRRSKGKMAQDLKDFIENSKWTFAKTYAATWPHHYIVRERVDAQKKIPMNID
jgi:hypothetical protein